jgi:hypothetical protein
MGSATNPQPGIRSEVWASLELTHAETEVIRGTISYYGE